MINGKNHKWCDSSKSPNIFWIWREKTIKIDS